LLGFDVDEFIIARRELRLAQGEMLLAFTDGVIEGTRPIAKLVRALDAKALAPLLAKTKSMGKPEFANWASMSDQGKAAAEGGDLAGAKATCKSCHDAYRAEYKTKYGSKAP
jgi:hypothetical protein